MYRRSRMDVDDIFFRRRYKSRKLDAIFWRHQRAKEMYKKVKICQDASDKSVWIVPSFTLSGELYKVRRVSLKDHTCGNYCDECDACIHEFDCDCPDSAENSNFCKHMHALCLINSDSCDESSNLKTANKKYLRQEAKEAVLELLTLLDQLQSEETYEEIIQTVNELNAKIEYEDCDSCIESYEYIDNNVELLEDCDRNVESHKDCDRNVESHEDCDKSVSPNDV